MALKFDFESFKLKSRQLGDAQRATARVLPVLPWLVSAVFFAAVAAGGASLYQASKVVAHSRQVHDAQVPSYKVRREPLSPQDYQAQVDWLARLHPDVKFTLPKKGGLRIDIADGAHHSEWMYALAALQAQGSDIVWDVDTFCVGRCEGAVAQAVVTGYRQKLVEAEN